MHTTSQPTYGVPLEPRFGKAPGMARDHFGPLLVVWNPTEMTFVAVERSDTELAENRFLTNSASDVSSKSRHVETA